MEGTKRPVVEPIYANLGYRTMMSSVTRPLDREGKNLSDCHCSLWYLLLIWPSVTYLSNTVYSI